MSLRIPASAGSTWRCRIADGVTQDHPRVGGEHAPTMTARRAASVLLRPTSPEGVIAA
ncbi:hypothetical protein SUDANB180_01976 [Streptomyces sp. enrichment culture]